MVGVAVLSISLAAVSGLMIDGQLRANRRQLAATGVTDRDRAFLRRQHRRRMQANTLIGIVGLLIAVWPLVQQGEPGTKVVYLASLLLAVLWMVSMAMLDAVAISRRYRRDRMQQIAEQARVALEVQRGKLEQQADPAGDQP